VEEDPELVLVRQIRRRRIQLAIGLTLVACVAMYPCCRVVWSCTGEMVESEQRRAEHEHVASPEQRAELERALAGVEASLPARQAAFDQATAGLRTLVPRPDLGPCPVHVPLRSGGSAQRGWSVDMNYDPFEAFGFPGERSFPWETLPVTEAPRVAYARERIASLREQIGRPSTLESIAGVVASAHTLEGPGFWTWDVVIVPETWRMPFVEPDGLSFDGGLAEGTAYLHDYASGSVICAGRFSATTTSQVVETHGSDWTGSPASASLRAEMEAEIERAISRALVDRAGPAVDPTLDPEIDAP